MSAAALHLFEEGRLRDAIAAMSEAVKAMPTDTQRRSQLAEFLCVAGELERAERQFEAIAEQDPTTALQVASLRQLVRADMARRQVWTEGRAPELLAPPPEHVALRLEALMHLREGRPQEAGGCLAKAEIARPALSGKSDDVPFTDFRDLDDLMGGILEVMTTTGKYYWVPMEQVDEIEFSTRARALDGAWRTAQISVRGGPDGEVVIPAIYPPIEVPAPDPILLGRETNWVEVAPDCIRGEGLRCFLVGEESVSIRQLHKIEFDAQ
ncbi:type VI secretion system accessory protein TagJ [Aquabacter spiritensis]|uniref:Type VI secretion system protein ImpE n=1 Tax=Aquabacter spiritensis TaxID=933073 RepID=A0A4R3LPY6_9HYPH|nr:type VI secretion system accessory protein TagJ [Aquabacter spiritensis]TCT02460.1 type VI secretion system protein ImpE [Aquabacter spiritensis]